jgi:hypothetical protein
MLREGSVNNIVRNEKDPTVDEIDVAPTAPHTLSFLSKLELGDS